MKDEHIEKELLKQNKIPGCDQLTRPEEIKALSKYLKNIRTTQENYTSLGKNNLEIPGITTGKLPEIDNLEDHIDTLKVTNSVELVNGSVSLDGNFKEVNNLENFKDNLLDDRDISLDNHEEYLIDDRKISLEHIKEKLNVVDKNKLSSQKIKLINNKEIHKLENTKENLDVEENIDSLENFSDKITLSDKNDIKELNEHVEKLVNTEQNIVNSLEKEKIYINNSNEITNLSNFKDSIEVQENKIIELSNKKESLKNIKNQVVNNISSYKEKIPNELKESNSLNTSNEKLRTPEELNNIYSEKIKLVGEVKDSNLSNYKEDFVGTINELSLNDTKINLEGEIKDQSLDNTRLNIIDDRDPTLSDYKEGFVGNINEPSLDNTKINIEDSRKNSLSDYKENFVGKIEDPTLSDYKEGFVGNINEPSLDNTKINIEDSRKNSLSNYKENFVGTINEPTLSNYIEDFIGDVKEQPLGDTKVDIEGEIKDSSLDNTKINIEDNRETTLTDYIEDLIGIINEPSLEDTIINIPDSDNNAPRTEGSYNYIPEDNAALYEESIERPDSYNNAPRQNSDYNYIPEDNAALYEESIERPETSIGPRQDRRLYKPLTEEELENYETIDEVNDEYKENIPETSIGPRVDKKLYKPLTEEELENYETINEVNGEYKESLIRSTTPILGKDSEGKDIKQEDYNYLDEQSTKDIIEGKGNRERINLEEVDKNSKLYGDGIKEDMPSYKLPEFNIDSLNLNNYIRWAAEKTVGQLKGGKGRDLLMDETIAALVVAREKLEKISKSNRDRLPGNDMGLISDLVSGGVSGALDNLGNRIGDAVSANFGKEIDTKNPINRPETGDSGEETGTTGWTSGNNRYSSSMPGIGNSVESPFGMKEFNLHRKISGAKSNQSESSSFWKKVGETAKDTLLGTGSSEKDYSFKTNYLSGNGIRMTLEDLCNMSPENSNLDSVENLMKLLKSSPFITTTNKFTSDPQYGYRSQTLDTNAYWELTLEPYVGVENGNISYLPGIHEINAINIAQHGVNTTYNRWIPYTSFDLQKSKMTSKTLSLYDGEISYPISMEFTNEFRLSIADDQYKSWRTYFERCAQVAIYNSEGHDENYYKNGGSGDSLEITAIDTSNVCIAMYKNICFRCRIYVMTPQYSTIRKFDLLLVLKDFSEEYTGDIDGGAGDLTVSFSIVGENPANVPMKSNTINPPEKKDSGKDYSSIIEGGVNSIIGLIK